MPQRRSSVPWCPSPSSFSYVLCHVWTLFPIPLVVRGGCFSSTLRIVMLVSRRQTHALKGLFSPVETLHLLVSHWLGPFTWLPSRREVPSSFWATRLPAVGPGSITEEGESTESGGQAGAPATLALSFTFSGEKTSSRGKTFSFPGRLGGWDLKFGPT